MDTKSAVEAVLFRLRITKYAMAKQLGIASSTSINQWLRNTRMSHKTAKRFEELYGIRITDSV